MKTRHFFLSFVFALIFCNSTFAQKPKPIPIVFQINKDFALDTLPSTCTLQDCHTRIRRLIDQYRPKANEFCQTLALSVSCCMEGSLAYILVYVEPNAIKCLEVDPYAPRQ